jgi:hypothetical protein
MNQLVKLNVASNWPDGSVVLGISYDVGLSRLNQQQVKANIMQSTNYHIQI